MIALPLIVPLVNVVIGTSPVVLERLFAEEFVNDTVASPMRVPVVVKTTWPRPKLSPAPTLTFEASAVTSPASSVVPLIEILVSMSGPKSELPANM